MSVVLPQTERLYDKAAEGCVLGSMIVDPSRIPSVLSVLIDESPFFFPEHKAILLAILAVWRQNGKALDGVLVRGELSRSGKLDAVGGVEYLQAILDNVPTAANAVYYAKRVLARQQYRDLVAAHDAIGKVLDEPSEIGEQVARVQEIALGLRAAEPQQFTFPVGQHATRVAMATQNGVSFMATGLRNLDWYISGFAPGGLIVLAGRPSMGKTALAVTIALNLAQEGKRVVFFTLEMSADELIERMISVLSGVNLLSIKRPNPDPTALNEFYAGALALERLPVVILENQNTVEQQLASLRQHAAADGVDIAFVDYMQLMTTGRRIDNRVQEVSAISRGLKLAAVRERIPIVALSQLNRECENRNSHRPRMSDLRDSGSLEQDADMVLLLHREDYYRKQQDPNATDLDGVTECIIAKHRGGPCGVAKLAFIEDCTKFADLNQEGFDA